MYILVIDDSVGTCLAMVNLIKKLGYPHTEAVHTGEEGIYRSTHCRPCPDVIFLDIMMVGMSGFDTLINLRKNGFQGRICMTTAINDMESQAFCLQNGANDYLIKTEIDIKVLKRCIKGD